MNTAHIFKRSGFSELLVGVFVDVVVVWGTGRVWTDTGTLQDHFCQHIHTLQDPCKPAASTRAVVAESEVRIMTDV